MILHLVTKHFYSNIGLAVFEKRAPGQNIVLVIGSMSNSVESVNNGIEVTEDNVGSIVKSLNFSQINQIVVHYLTQRIGNFIQKYIPQGIPLYWWTYGGDLYAPYLEMRGYELLYNDLTPFKPGWRFMIRRFIYTKKTRIKYRWDKGREDGFMQNELLGRINGIIPCIPPDYQVACEYLKKDFKLVRIHPFVCPQFDETFFSGNVISIGHSGSWTDNHLYALKYISNIDTRDSVLSLTLSYNTCDKEYLNVVKQRYKKQYKEKVVFVEDYLSKEEYYDSQNRINTMILPTWRQEALMNIVSCFLRGIKLYLSNRSPMYKHFKDYGFKFSAIEDMNQKEFDTQLTIDEKQYNRNLMLRYLEEKERLIDEDFNKYFGDNNTGNN